MSGLSGGPRYANAGHDGHRGQMSGLSGLSGMRFVAEKSRRQVDLGRTFLNGLWSCRKSVASASRKSGSQAKPRTRLSTPQSLMIFCTRIRKTDQIFAHIENKSSGMESAMTFKQGVSGNPHGNRHRTRHLLNQEFMQALLLNFRHEGKKAIEKVARDQPAAYLKILALLVPREMKVEHSGGVKAMTDEQLEAGIEAIQAMLEQRADIPTKVIEGTAETIALPAPDVVPDGLNEVMDAADTAVRPKERNPRKCEGGRG